MAIFPVTGGSQNTWGDELRAFVSRYFNPNTGNVVPASFDHTTDLASVGTNSHAAIDVHVATAVAFIATKAAASGLASLDANSKVVQEPATKAQASGVASLDANSKVVQEPASKAQASGIASLNSSSLVVQNPANATATPAASVIVVSDTSSKIDGWTTKYPSIQTVVTTSRTVGTVYQNTSGRPMLVVASVRSSVAGATFTLSTDGNASPATPVCQITMAAAAGNIVILTAFALPGNYYKVTLDSGTPTVNLWTEWY
jgi:hypothetical protein